MQKKCSVFFLSLIISMPVFAGGDDIPPYDGPDKARFRTTEPLTYEALKRLNKDAVYPIDYTARDLNNFHERRATSMLPPSLSIRFNAIRDAAEGGNPLAQAQLGDLYFDGMFAEKNMDLALKWYRLAAHNGFAYAQYILAILYQEGIAVKQDIQLSGAWMRKADKSPHKVVAQRLVGDRSFNRDSDFFNEARGLQWYSWAANANDLRAQLALASYYSRQSNHTAEIAALKWYGKAADKHEDAVAQYNLGLIFADGIGVKKDEKEAFKWFKKAASQRMGPAQFHLAQSYQKGLGTKRDPVKAYAWYVVAANELSRAGSLNDQVQDAIAIMNRNLSKEQLKQASALGWKLNRDFAQRPKQTM